MIGKLTIPIPPLKIQQEIVRIPDMFTELTNISTTANIYVHLDSRSKQLSAATMEKALALPESRW